jgi:hypothetical protein
MFENQARGERYNISKALFACKLAEGSPINPHVIKMIGYMETLDKLGCDVRVSKAKVAAIAISTFHLPLPSGLVLESNNCYCIPTLCKNIISSSCLEEVDGYEIIIKNKRCSIYYNGIFFAHCPLVNGLYVLDFEDKSICNINTKRA